MMFICRLNVKEIPLLSNDVTLVKKHKHDEDKFVFIPT